MNDDTKSLKEFFIYGRQPALEALRSEYTVNKIWMAKGNKGPGIGNIRRLADLRAVKIEEVLKNKLQKFTGPVVHQGIAASVAPLQKLTTGQFKHISESKTSPLILILDQVQDPHNLGAIIRTAEISGVDVIVYAEKGTAKLNATVAKTSAGALFHMQFYETHDIVEIIERLNAAGIQTYASVMKSEMPMYEASLHKGSAIIIGSEGKGLRKNIANLCTDQIFIPQFGKVNSLNVSVAAAILLYEAVRQRNV